MLASCIQGNDYSHTTGVQRKREEREKAGQWDTFSLYFLHLIVTFRNITEKCEATLTLNKLPFRAFDIRNYSTIIVVSTHVIILWKKGSEHSTWD